MKNRREVLVFSGAVAFVGVVISCGMVNKVGVSGGNAQLAKEVVETANKSACPY